MRRLSWHLSWISLAFLALALARFLFGTGILR